MFFLETWTLVTYLVRKSKQSTSTQPTTWLQMLSMMEIQRKELTASTCFRRFLFLFITNYASSQKNFREPANGMKCKTCTSRKCYLK